MIRQLRYESLGGLTLRISSVPCKVSPRAERSWFNLDHTHNGLGQLATIDLGFGFVDTYTFNPGDELVAAGYAPDDEALR